MAKTYDPTQVDFSGDETERRNALRLVLRETNTSKTLFEDEELDAILDDAGNVWRAAVSSASIKTGNVRRDELGRKKVEYWETMQPTWLSNARRGEVPVIVDREVSC